MTEALAASLPLGAVQAGANTAQSLARSDMSETALHQLVLTQLDDDQAQEVVSIPLEGKSSIADHMVIASGRSTRQVASMAQKLAEKIKQAGFGHARVEGLPAADWVLIDAGDVVVHLFRPEVRSFYNLERMWSFEGSETSMLGRN
jgi:ribosome-associated protein